MRKIVLSIVLVCMLALQGCVIPLQIKTNDEVFNGVSPAVNVIATYYKIKRPGKVGEIAEMARKVLNADANKLTEQYFNEWKNDMLEGIKDPFERAVATQYINSFEISIDGNAVLDGGSRDTVRRSMEMFLALVE